MSSKKPVRFVHEELKLDFDTVALCRFGISSDGDYVTCKVERTLVAFIPYTSVLRYQVERSRGRDSFSYGKSVCVLPSAHYYKRRSHEEQLDSYRDEED